MTEPRIVVRVSELIVTEAPATLMAIALGSCVAVALHDPTTRIGGLAHVLLPSQAMGRIAGQPGRYAQTAVPALIERMIARGARTPSIVARLVGGASMFVSLSPPGTIQMGDRNVVAAREALHRHGIRLIGEAVGGDFGRTAAFDLETGRITITSYNRGGQLL
ncbi:MAG: chemotaxis protein CheD [Gemmatimonadetes bacterium]|nr:chemotaxis protein CheD [Gemmatimonadota bacterium]MCC7134299.1 chemotaxis protein CheD [Gemmatimonadales bacterium]